MKEEEMEKHKMTFQHPFSMVVSGSSGSRKTEWTREVLRTSFIDPSPQCILCCYGQWQTLYEELRKEMPTISFIMDHLNSDL